MSTSVYTCTRSRIQHIYNYHKCWSAVHGMVTHQCRRAVVQTNKWLTASSLVITSLLALQIKGTISHDALLVQIPLYFIG